MAGGARVPRWMRQGRRRIGQERRRLEPVQIRARRAGPPCANRRSSSRARDPAISRPVCASRGRAGTVPSCSDTRSQQDACARLREVPRRLRGRPSGVERAAPRRHGEVGALLRRPDPDPPGLSTTVNRSGAARATRRTRPARRTDEGPLRAATRQVDLPFAPAPDRGDGRPHGGIRTRYVRVMRGDADRLDRDGHLRRPAGAGAGVRLGTGLTSRPRRETSSTTAAVAREYTGQAVGGGLQQRVCGSGHSLRVIEEGDTKGGGRDRLRESGTIRPLGEERINGQFARDGPHFG